jgi:ferredoxin
VVSVHIEADRELCVGAGNCVLTLPDVFDQDDEGLVDVLDPDPPDEQGELVGRAVRLCPSGALRISA